MMENSNLNFNEFFEKHLKDLIEVTGLPPNVIVYKYDSSFSLARKEILRVDAELKNFFAPGVKNTINRITKLYWDMYPNEQNTIIGLA